MKSGSVLGAAVRVGPEAVQQAQRQRESGLSSAAGSIGSAKKDEEDFDPAALNDVARWLRLLRHKYTPNFEGMFWKEMVLMDEQALEAQGVAALGARRGGEGNAQDIRGRQEENGN